MKKLIFLFGLLSLLFYSSCEKESDESPDTERIVIGNADQSNMVVSLINPMLQIASSENGGFVPDSIDLDNDEVYDIVFTSFGQRWANMSSCGIEVINDYFEILVSEIIDSVLYTYDNQNSQINSAMVTWNTFSQFMSYSGNDSLSYSHKEYCVKNYNSGDIIELDDTILVWKTSGVFASYTEGYNYYSTFYQHFRMGFWNDKGEMYLCFRKKQGPQSKYGWIKAGIEWNRIITISEYAIGRG